MWGKRRSRAATIIRAKNGRAEADESKVNISSPSADIRGAVHHRNSCVAVLPLLRHHRNVDVGVQVEMDEPGELEVPDCNTFPCFKGSRHSNPQ
jgi:hypothetical protein